MAHQLDFFMAQKYPGGSEGDRYRSQGCRAITRRPAGYPVVIDIRDTFITGAPMLTRLSPRGAVVATIAAASLGAAITFGSGSAYATPEDDAFIGIVKQLNIPMPSTDDAIQVGRGICSAMDAGRIEPAPTIRGVVSSLRSKGLDKGQSVGLLRGAISVYCPQYTALVAR
jgi:hypothetical protein